MTVDFSCTYICIVYRCLFCCFFLSTPSPRRRRVIYFFLLLILHTNSYIFIFFFARQTIILILMHWMGFFFRVHVYDNCMQYAIARAMHPEWSRCGNSLYMHTIILNNNIMQVSVVIIRCLIV